MSFFKDIALPVAALGIPVTPLKAQTKDAFLTGWQHSATTDVNQIDVWAVQFPESNCGAVATGKEGDVWFFESDNNAVFDRIKNDTGRILADEIKTFMVQSRAGRGHLYFRNTPASLAMGNIAQTYVKGGDFSVRVRNQYVVTAGSIHPDTKQPYKCLTPGVAPVPAPDWFIQWLLQQRTSTKTNPTDNKQDILVNENGLIPHGYFHGWLVSKAGTLRSLGFSVEKIERDLIELAHAHLEPPIDEEKVRQTARSMANYEANPASSIKMELNQKPDVLSPLHPALDESEAYIRPVFPHWALSNTSIWTGLVEPALKTSSKHAEFIYMPTAQVIMNYLSGKVGIKMHKTPLNLFVGLISPYGEFFKSSSCQLAFDYCNAMGICTPLTRGRTNPNSAVMHGQAGSPEGFGLAIKKADPSDHPHAILFNDELGKFVSKAGIESSSFADDLLSWYGAGSFGNNVTSEKNSFQFEPGTYSFGWLWCTTDRGFNRHWPKLAGMASGLKDRMFFVVSPEKPKPTVPFHDPMFLHGAVETRRRIDAAIEKKQYEFDDPVYFSERVKGMDPRSMEMVMNLCLFLTIDMGLEKIDDEIIDRALALVDYRNKTSAFLDPVEADNQQGRLQKEIIRELRQNRGKISYRDLCLNLDYSRYGIDVWNRAYSTMVPAEIICEWSEVLTPGKRPTRMVGLVNWNDEAAAA